MTKTIPTRTLPPLLMLMALASAGCKRHGDAAQLQTHFPGMVTAGGHTSGQVMAAHGGPKTDGTYAGGTPGIAGGAGGNTSGAATGGSVTETGKGPTQGVSTPGGAAAQGATRSQPGDFGRPAAPTPAEQGPAPAATHRDPAAGAGSAH